MTRKTAAGPTTTAGAGWARLARVATWLIHGAMALLALGVILFFALIVLSRTSYDDDTPDGAALLARLDAARAPLGDRASLRTGAQVDLSDVNGGAWRQICLYGGYRNLTEDLRDRGVELTPADVATWAAKRRLFRINEVEEGEFGVAVIEDAGRVRLLHLSRGLGSFGDHYAACVNRPQTSVWVTGG
ncbi:hypothetical protein ACFQ4O_11150 [Methylopila musalis]|uniref:Uncharacterized protein n=1 Tax=Methylopila musalis TaxID=1134781 RepID=A0ABW3Z8J0_9HYPH